MTGRVLWLRLGVSWLVAAALLVLAHPAAPRTGWHATGSAFAGLAAGGAVAWLVAGLRPNVSGPVAVTLVVAAGAEEVVWRWFALGSLAGVAGAPGALAATSLAFGAVHPGARGQHVATGLAFGGVYVATGSLLGAWCAHALYNLLVASAARRPPPEPA
jgi:membrane protease YdiL (CAAX protease family)